MKKRWKRSFVTALSMALAVGNCIPVIAAPAGWRQSAAGWQYVNADGSVQKGWFQDTKGDWYFLDYNTGVMKTGWIQPADGKWYFTDYHTGAMKTGWIKPKDGKWYYLNPNSDGTKGSMQTGWVQTPDKKWYYMDASGAMMTGKITVDNQVWTLDVNGAWDGKAATNTTATYISSSSRRPSSRPPVEDDSTDNPGEQIDFLKVEPSKEAEGYFDVTIQKGSDTPITAEMINKAAKVTDAAKNIQKLTIAESVGNGNVTLEGLTVNGETEVNGGGHNSIWFRGCTLKNVKTGKGLSVPLRILFVGTTKVEGTVTITGGNVTVGIENKENVKKVEAVEGAKTVTLVNANENKKVEVLLPELTVSAEGITVKVEIPVTTVAVTEENVIIDTTETASIEKVEPAENVDSVTIEGTEKDKIGITGFVDVTLNAEGGWTVVEIDEKTGVTNDVPADKKVVSVREETTLRDVVKANAPNIENKVVAGWYKSSDTTRGEKWDLGTKVVKDETITWELWAKLEDKAEDDNKPSNDQLVMNKVNATVESATSVKTAADNTGKTITIDITTTGSAVKVTGLSVETNKGIATPDVSGWEEIIVDEETTEIKEVSIDDVTVKVTINVAKKGVTQSGWTQIDEKWYYFGTDGVMQTGWAKIHEKWYYLGTDGVMQTGWTQVHEKWYYLGTDGMMQTGWTQVHEKWHYLGTDGVMQTGWMQMDEKWYYLGTDGVMVAGTTQEIGGVSYTFAEDGHLVE